LGVVERLLGQDWIDWYIAGDGITFESPGRSPIMFNTMVRLGELLAPVEKVTLQDHPMTAPGGVEASRAESQDWGYRVFCN
jgi:hypothetical protein